MLEKQSGLGSSDSKSSRGTSGVTFSSAKHGFKSNNADSEGSEFSVSDSFLGNRSTPVYNHSLSYPLSDVTCSGKSLDLFQNISSTDLLCDDIPEICSFEDVDRMFRRSDSTFGLVDSKGDEYGWLSSEYDKGESGEALQSDFGFPCHETSLRANVSENHGSSKSYTELSEAPISVKDDFCTREESDSYTSFVNELGMCDGKYGFIPEEQGYPSAHMSRHLQATGSDSFFYLQNNGSQSYSDDGQLSDRASVTFTHSTSLAPWVSSHPSNQMRFMGSSHDPQSLLTALIGTDNGADICTFQNNLSSRSTSLMEQAFIQDPGLVGKQVKLCGDQFENPTDAGGVSLVIPVEPASSNVQESTMMNMGADDISLAAASFSQLQLVMEWLDLRTKLCIRDGLYRLARSAEQRLNQANPRGDSSSGKFMAEETNNRTSLTNMETGTNPIDRSIAQLLFHRPSDSSVIFAHYA